MFAKKNPKDKKKNKIQTNDTKKTWETPAIIEINKTTILNQPGVGGDGGVAGSTLT
jgi:hypothetical protein